MLLIRGIFSAYNIGVNDPNHQTLSQYRHQLICHRNASPSSRRGKVLVVMAMGKPSTPQQRSETMVSGYQASLADQIRLGGLMENGVYEEKFIVRSCEVGVNKTATIQTIANYLQEVACTHFQCIGFCTDGFPTTHTMRKLNLIWVVARMHIQIFKYPAWSDVVEIKSWYQSEGRIGTGREWILRNYATGEAIGRATSILMMINRDTRRLQKDIDQLRDEIEPYFSPERRLAFPEENNSSLKKIAKLEDPAQYSSLGLVPRLIDIDMNHHVNNVAYIGWILESLPREIIDTYELVSITLDYRRECQRDDVVDSLTSLELIEEDDFVQGSNGSNISAKEGNHSMNFLHSLRLSRDGTEISRGRTKWRKNPAKP